MELWTAVYFETKRVSCSFPLKWHVVFDVVSYFGVSLGFRMTSGPWLLFHTKWRFVVLFNYWSCWEIPEGAVFRVNYSVFCSLGHSSYILYKHHSLHNRKSHISSFHPSPIMLVWKWTILPVLNHRQIDKNSHITQCFTMLNDLDRAKKGRW